MASLADPSGAVWGTAGIFSPPTHEHPRLGTQAVWQPESTELLQWFFCSPTVMTTPVRLLIDRLPVCSS